VGQGDQEHPVVQGDLAAQGRRLGPVLHAALANQEHLGAPAALVDLGVLEDQKGLGDLVGLESLHLLRTRLGTFRKGLYGLAAFGDGAAAPAPDCPGAVASVEMRGRSQGGTDVN
jgi:hypothetical protein